MGSSWELMGTSSWGQTELMGTELMGTELMGTGLNQSNPNRINHIQEPQNTRALPFSASDLALQATLDMDARDPG